jgi:hypothetical protein
MASASGFSPASQKTSQSRVSCNPLKKDQSEMSSMAWLTGPFFEVAVCPQRRAGAAFCTPVPHSLAANFSIRHEASWVPTPLFRRRQKKASLVELHKTGLFRRPWHLLKTPLMINIYTMR